MAWWIPLLATSLASAGSKYFQGRSSYNEAMKAAMEQAREAERVRKENRAMFELNNKTAMSQFRNNAALGLQGANQAYDSSMARNYNLYGEGLNTANQMKSQGLQMKYDAGMQKPDWKAGLFQVGSDFGMGVMQKNQLDKVLGLNKIENTFNSVSLNGSKQFEQIKNNFGSSFGLSSNSQLRNNNLFPPLNLSNNQNSKWTFDTFNSRRNNLRFKSIF